MTKKFKFDVDKVNTWVLENVNEKAVNHYYNFIADLVDGIAIKYSKRAKYNVNDFVYLYKAPKTEEYGDFYIEFNYPNMVLPLSSDMLNDTDKVIALVKCCWELHKSSIQMWKITTDFMESKNKGLPVVEL
jgi:hypothetical protein